MTTYTIAVTIRVDNKKRLYGAALKYVVEVDEMDPWDARQMLSTGRNINVGACLQFLIDPGSLPGCVVLQSDVEICTDFD